MQNIYIKLLTPLYTHQPERLSKEENWYFMPEEKIFY